MFHGKSIYLAGVDEDNVKSCLVSKNTDMVSPQDGLNGVFHRVTSPSVSELNVPSTPCLASEDPMVKHRATMTKVPESSEPFPLSPHSPLLSATTRANEQQAVMNLVNSILGAAVLSFAFCTKGMGVILMPLVVVIAATMNRISQRLMLYSGALANKMSYEGIAYAAMGRPGTWVIKWCSLGINFGCLVAYINVTSDVLSSVAGSVIPPGAEPSRQAIMTGVVFAGMIPLSLGVNNTHLLGAMSTVSIGLIVVFTGVMVVMGLGSLTHLDKVTKWNLDGLPVAFPIIAFAFSSQTILFDIASSLKSPSVTKMGRVIDKAIMLCGFVYLCCGVGGYLAFRERTGGDVLRNLGAGMGMRTGYERMLKLAYGFSVLTGVPLVLIPIHSVLVPIILQIFDFVPFVASLLRPGKARSSVLLKLSSIDPRPTDSDAAHAHDPNAKPGPSHFQRSSTFDSFNLDLVDLEMPWLRHLVSVGLLVLALVIAVKVPNMEFIFGLIGSTSIPILSYLMPGCIYLNISQEQQKSQSASLMSNSRSSAVSKLVTWQRQAMALMLIVVGLVSIVVCTRATLMAVHEEAQVVKVAKDLVTANQVLQQAQATEEEVQKLATTVTAVDEVTRKFATLKNSTDETYASTKEANTSLEKFQSVQPHNQSSIWDVKQRVKNYEADAKRSNALDDLAQNLKIAQSRANVSKADIEDVKSTLEQIHAANVSTTAAASTAKAADAPPSPATPPPVQPANIADAAQSIATSHDDAAQPDRNDALDKSVAVVQEKTDAASDNARSASVAASGEQELGMSVGEKAAAPPPVAPAEGRGAANATAEGGGADGAELARVLDQADITLASLESSVKALERVDAAAVALAKAQRRHDPVATLTAIQDLQLAINATFATSEAINQTMLLLQQTAANQTISMHKLLVHMLGEINSGLKEPTTKSAANVFWHAQDTPLTKLNVTRPGSHWDPLGSIRGTGSFKFSTSQLSPPPAVGANTTADGSNATANSTEADAVGGGDSRIGARGDAVAHLQELAKNITSHMNEAKSMDGTLVDNNALYLSTLVQAAKAAVEVAKQNTEEAQKNVEKIVATADSKVSSRAAEIAKELASSTAKPPEAKAPPDAPPSPQSPPAADGNASASADPAEPAADENKTIESLDTVLEQQEPQPLLTATTEPTSSTSDASSTHGTPQAPHALQDVPATRDQHPRTDDEDDGDVAGPVIKINKNASAVEARGKAKSGGQGTVDDEDTAGPVIKAGGRHGISSQATESSKKSM